MSQERMSQVESGKAVVSDTFQVPEIDATLTRASKAMSKVRVMHGANEQYYDLASKTVGSVRKSLRDVLNIPGDAEAILDGKAVGDDIILEGGQSLEFVKSAGVKGR